MPHTYTRLRYHIVFSTKHRETSLAGPWLERMHSYLGGIVRNIEGNPIEIGGVEDHVHILCELPPVVSISDAIRTIKANSSRWLNNERSFTGKFAWQEGYGAFTMSDAVLEDSIRYVQNQREHHKHQSFQDELRAFLKKHGIEFDEKYLWD